jgi:hypothetical protein
VAEAEAAVPETFREVETGEPGVIDAVGVFRDGCFVGFFLAFEEEAFVKAELSPRRRFFPPLLTSPSNPSSCCSEAPSLLPQVSSAASQPADERAESQVVMEQYQGTDVNASKLIDIGTVRHLPHLSQATHCTLSSETTWPSST